MTSSTLFAASVEWFRKAGSMLVLDPPIGMLPDGAPGPRRFKIKAADSESRRGLVASLLKGRYLWRGYRVGDLPSDHPTQRFTLAAIEDQQTIGTITVAFDGPDRLAADQTFPHEVQSLRDKGLKLCEFTKLAIDPTTGTKRVLAALFHVAYIVAHRMRGHDTLLIEVNPRHVRYYERMLGCSVLGEPRINRSVDAPAVLLTVEFSYIMSQIGKFGGQPELSATERSLYPFAFSLPEEAGIITRLRSRYEHWLEERDRVAVRDSDFAPSDLMGV
ncbi:N-acyl amino acid synthase FeeM domain-containing protein [Ideonella sp. A 288]|uniref:N-acyl amino acid synthase FeeM domain-containing protein n=1 Tax=Ideonella sp. A 288 TaxID=1962181 RepID=UPI000B4BE6E1|nr:long-chain N-acyl amino acid synthase [Ideonella sp. A 288]